MSNFKTMKIKIGRYSFDGIFHDLSSISDKSGVYAVFSIKGKKETLIDVGESAKVYSRLKNHSRKDCWSKHNPNENWGFAVHYTYGLHKAGRLHVEQEIRRNQNLACGIK